MDSGLPHWLSGKESACSAGDAGSIPGSGRSVEVGNGHPLQYSCLGIPMNRGVWWATVHGGAKSWTRLSKWVCAPTHTHKYTHTHRWTAKGLSCIYTCVHSHPTHLPSRLPYNIEQTSCYTVSPCWLSILNIAVCTCQLPNYPFPSFVPL